MIKIKQSYRKSLQYIISFVYGLMQKKQQNLYKILINNNKLTLMIIIMTSDNEN